MKAIGRLQSQLELIIYLSGGIYRTISEIQSRFGISERTAYRYLEVIRNAGFILEHDLRGYVLDLNEGMGKSISDLLHFSREEAFILSKAIHSIDDNHVMKANLINKLYSLYDFERVPHSIFDKKRSETVHRLIEAIHQKKQVILRDYRSASSSIIRDRLTEPFAFTTNFINCWCFDPEERKNKIFKTQRIGSVEITDRNWQFADLHQEGETDAFRFTGFEKHPVKLRLGLLAYNLLIEEYPLAEPDIKKISDTEYLYDSWVCSFEGVGRFVMGLPGKVEVLESKELKNYLRKEQNNQRF